MPGLSGGYQGYQGYQGYKYIAQKRAKERECVCERWGEGGEGVGENLGLGHVHSDGKV